MNSRTVKALAQECGFELAGVAPAAPASEAEYYQRWVAQGFAGEMTYLTDRRAEVRNDPRNLLPSARSVICVGKLYNGPQPYSTKFQEPELGWISRYAWGEDYHDVLRRGLERLVEKLREDARRSSTRSASTPRRCSNGPTRGRAGLGWIGKNTCLINQQMGSWFFLGELLISIEIEPDAPPPDRCGTCTRCIDACPTAALIPHESGYALDSRLCISYFTIELRTAVPRSSRGNRKPCLRLRHLSRCVPLEYEESCRVGTGLRAAAVCAAARIARRFDRGGISRDVSRVADSAVEIQRISAKRGGGDGQRALGEISRAAAEIGGIGRAAGGGTRALGLGTTKLKLEMRLLAIGFLSAIGLFGQATAWAPYDAAFHHFYNLEYDQAIAELEKGVAKEPNSAEVHNHLAQCIQFREMYKVGALESELVSGNNSFLRRPKIDTTPEIEKRFQDEVRKAMEISEARLKTNPNDTQALYALGVSYALRGNWNFLVRKAWRDALHDATEARKLHNKVSELDPSNYDARLVQGAHDYIIGSLPTLYKMLGFLVGFHGDKEKGMRTLQEVAAKGKANAVDAKVFLCAIYRREERWQAAAPILEELIRSYPRNYLLRFEQAQMYSATGQKDKAIAAIQAVADLKKKGAPGYANLAAERILLPDRATFNSGTGITRRRSTI